MATTHRWQSPAQLATHPKVATASAWLRQQDAALTELQVEFACLPSPDLRAAPRAAVFEARAREWGLQEVQVDRVGNVCASIPGVAPQLPAVVLSAHLDINVIRIVNQLNLGLVQLFEVSHGLSEG